MSLTQRPRRSQRIFFLCDRCGLCVRHKFFRNLPERRVRLFLTRIFFDAEDSREHTNDIAVEDWCWLIERDAADRARGVTADARQREDVGEVFRKASAALTFDELRSLLQIAHARVI